MPQTPTGPSEGNGRPGDNVGNYPPSPVPADERLWPGELPFTAFGQFGEDRLDLRVFDQDTYWVDRHGAPHLLTDMPLDYLANVLDFLLTYREAYFHLSIHRAAVQSLGDYLLYDEPNGDVLAAQLGMPTWDDLTAEAWLEGTPLMRRLRALLATKRSTGPNP